MKKTINGALYDTKTAKRIGKWQNEFLPTDLNFTSESLYRTKSGRYFLYGKGGTAANYGKHDDRDSGQWITPVTRKNAKLWVKNKLSDEAYKSAFGLNVEKGEKVALNITINAALKAKLWNVAENQEITLNALVENILEKFTEDGKNEKRWNCLDH